jgi:hypothetical protein
MKRAELSKLGLEESIIDSIMKLHGETIEAKKKDIASLTAEIETLKATNDTYKSQLDDTSLKLKDFESMDINAIKKSAEDIKAQYEVKEKELTSKLDKQAYDFKMKEYISQFEFTSELAKKGVINELNSKGFKLDGEKFLGADDFMKELKDSNPTAFINKESDKEPKPNFGTPTTNSGKGTNDAFGDSFFKAVMGK